MAVAAREEERDGRQLVVVSCLGLAGRRGRWFAGYSALQHRPDAGHTVMQCARAHLPRFHEDCLNFFVLGVVIVEFSHKVSHIVRLSLAAGKT
jgi:hypothetical protein